MSQVLRNSNKFVLNKGPHNLLALDVEKLTMLQKIANLKMPPAMHAGKRAILPLSADPKTRILNAPTGWYNNKKFR